MPEFELYREAQVYDRVVKSGGLPLPQKSTQEPSHSLRKSLPSAPSQSRPELTSKSRVDVTSKPRADVPDNVSETGTYTIDVEQDTENEFELSRQSIDKIFGVEAEEEEAEDVS